MTQTHTKVIHNHTSMLLSFARTLWSRRSQCFVLCSIHTHDRPYQVTLHSHTNTYTLTCTDVITSRISPQAIHASKTCAMRNTFVFPCVWLSFVYATHCIAVVFLFSLFNDHRLNIWRIFFGKQIRKQKTQTTKWREKKTRENSVSSAWRLLHHWCAPNCNKMSVEATEAAAAAVAATVQIAKYETERICGCRHTTTPNNNWFVVLRAHICSSYRSRWDGCMWYWRCPQAAATYLHKF